MKSSRTFNALTVSEKFRTTLRRWSLWSPKDRLLVAVSGGVDSIVLLHLLKNLSPASRPSLAVAHFDHRLRGRESASDFLFVRNLCREWKISFYGGRAKAWRSHENLEARARALRYDFLKKSAKRFKARKILLAHHAGDQAETFLIHWLQGAGLKGISGMPLLRLEKEYELIRPLLLVGKKDIRSYASYHDLEYREDSSNREGRFLRNRVRRLVTQLERENPKLSERAAINAIFLQADQAYLESESLRLFSKMRGKGRGSVFSLKAYRQLSPALRFRCLQKMVHQVAGEFYTLPSESILLVDELLRGEAFPKHLDLPGGLQWDKRQTSFSLVAKSKTGGIKAKKVG